MASALTSVQESLFAWDDRGAKFYTELRYHRAYHRGIDTQVLPLTFGFRF